MKKISLMLVVTMILSMFVTPIYGSATDNILVNDGFESYNDVSELTVANRWHWGLNNSASKSSIETEGDNKVFALNLDAQTDNIALLKGFDKVTENYLKVSVDVKASATNLTVPVCINDSKVFVQFSGGKVKAGTTTVAEYEANRWYNMTAYFDLANKTYDIIITSDDGWKKVAKNITTDQTAISSVKMQCWVKKDATAYFDNLYVEKLDEKPEIPILVSEDFELYTNVSELTTTNKWYWGLNNSASKSSIETDGDNKVFALNLDAQTDNIALLKGFDKVTEKYLKVSVDVKATATNLTVPICINDYNIAMVFEGGKIKAGGKSIISYEADKWYNVTAYFDIVNQTYDVVVTDGTSKTVLKNVTTNQTAIGSVKMQCWAKKDETAYFDNLYVEKLDEKPMISIVTEDDFEGYDSVADMINWQMSGAQNKAEIVTEDDNNMLSLNLDSETDSIWAIREFSKIDTGSVKVKTSVMSDDLNLTVALGLHSSSPWFVYAKFTKGEIKTEAGKVIGAYEANKWYDVEADFNLLKKTYDVIITSPEGEKTETKNIPFYNLNLEEASSVWLQCWSKLDATVHFDNFSVEHYHKAPALATSDVKVYDADSQVVENWNEIPAENISIELDFGTLMNEDTVNSDNIRLVSENDNEEISYEGTLNGNLYKIVPDKLEEGATYNLVISKDVENIEGSKMTEDVTIVLKTEETVTPPVLPESVLVSDGFESYNDVSELTVANHWHWGLNDSASKSSIETEGDNKVFALNLDAQTDNIALLKAFTKVEENYLKVSVDVKASATNLTVPLNVNDYRQYVRFDGGEIIANGDVVAEYEAGRWYNVTAYFDIAAQTYDIVITDDTGYSRAIRNVTTTQEAIGSVKMQCWTKKDATAYFDNLYIEKLDEKPEILADDETYPGYVNITDSFEKYTALSDMSKYSISAKSMSSLVEEDQNTFFRLGLDENTDNIYIERSFKAVEDGILEVKTSFRKSDTKLTVPLSAWSSAKQYFTYFMASGDKMYAGDKTEQLATLEVGKWYDVYARFNVNTKTYAVTVSDGINSYTSKKLAFPNTSVTDISMVKLQCWSKVNADADFDNLYIKSSMAPPEINSDSVKFYGINGTESVDLLNVSTDTSKIIIDFKTEMDSESLAGIKIVNRSTNKEVAFTASATEKTYELMLDEILNAKTTYALIIPATVKNLINTELGEEKTVAFVTTEEINDDLSVKINDISNGSTQVTTLAELTVAGADAEINLNYQNATNAQTDVNICVITSYYNGEQLVKTTASDKTVSKDVVNTVLNYELPVENIEGVDCIKVFVWDNTTNIKPYCPCAVFR